MKLPIVQAIKDMGYGFHHYICRQPIDQVTIPSEMGIALKCLRQRKISTKLLLVRLYLMVLMVHV